MGINTKGNIKDAMLDVVFGEHVFVGAENKKDLKKKKKKDVITLLSEMEKQCLLQDELLSNNVLFSTYMESRERLLSGKL